MHRGYKPEFSEFMETLLSSLHSMHVAFSVMGAIKLKILRGDAASENYETILHTFACSSLIILWLLVLLNRATLLDICITNVPCEQCLKGVFSLDIIDYILIFTFVPVPSNKHKITKNSCDRDIIISTRYFIIRLKWLAGNPTWF